MTRTRSDRPALRLAVLVAAMVLVLLPQRAHAQGLLGLGGSEVSLPAEQSPRDEVLSQLEERESDFEARVDAFQSRYGWRLERLAERRQTVDARIDELVARRAGLDPVAEAEERRVVGELLVKARQLAQRIGQVEEAYDTHLSALTDAASFARQLRIHLEGVERAADASVEVLDSRIAEAQQRLDALEEREGALGNDREELQSSLASTREQLAAARDRVLADELAESQRQVRRDAALARASERAAGVQRAASRVATQVGEVTAAQRRGWFRGRARQLTRRGLEAGWTAALAPDPRPWIALVAAPFDLLTRGDFPGARAPSVREAVARAEVLIARARARAVPGGGAAASASRSPLEHELQQLDVRLLDRRRELERERLEVVYIELEKVAAERPVVAYERGWLGERRQEAAARAAGGLLSRERGAFDGERLDALAEHAAVVFATPGRAWRAAREHLSLARGESPSVAGWALLGLAALAGYPLFRLLRRLAGSVGRPGQRPPWYKSLRLLALVLPAGVLVGAALLVGALPPGLTGTAWVFVVAPPAWIAVGLSNRLLHPVGGTETLSPVGGRRWRRWVWATTVAVTLLMLAAAALPVMGFPDPALAPVRGLALVVALVGLTAVLARRRHVLARLGLGGAEEGTLRRTMGHLYPALVAAPVVIAAVALAGYHELSAVLLRRGLLTLAVLLVLPWAHGKAQAAARRLLGYPDGGGTLETRPRVAVRSYRLVAPALTLLLGGAALLVIAVSWGLRGGVFENIDSFLNYALLSFGDTEISVLSLVLFALTVVATVAATRWLLPRLREQVYPIYDLTEGMRAALDTLVKYALFVLGLAVGLQVIGLGLGFLAIFAGVIGVAVGFGSQTLASNFISGLILQFSRPVNVGDHIEVEGVVGRIERISSYATVVRTFENVSVIVPNSVLIGEKVVNWTEGEKRRRFNVDVGVAYGSDVELVTKLLLEVAERHERVLAWPEAGVKFQGFGDSSLDFSLQVWIGRPEAIFGVASDLRYAIDASFREHDIEIPFPQRDLHVRSSEAVIALARAKGWDARGDEEAGEPARRYEADSNGQTLESEGDAA